VAGALYLAVGLASGVWVAPTKWLFWTTYFWAAFVLLPQAMSAGVWAYFQRYPTPLQGDYAHGYFLNTRDMRAYLDSFAQRSEESALLLVVLLFFLFMARLLLNFVASVLPIPVFAAAAEWVLRLHPWYGAYLEWSGRGALYLPYSLAWVVLLWARNWQHGLRSGREAMSTLQQRCEQLKGERAPEETPKSVA
jgi:membrane protein implicated in regulation of membrane protease activity